MSKKKKVYCPGCGVEILMDAFGFPRGRVALMTRMSRESDAVEAHPWCFIEQLRPAGWELA